MNESEVFDAWFVKTKDNKQNSTPDQYKFIVNKPHSKKHKLEEINKTVYEKPDLIQSKKICLNQVVILNECTPLVPRGISWSQNSCGYDAALTILYSIWNEDSEKWSENFKNLKIHI